MWTVYVLLSSADGKRYTGATSNLERRLAEHIRGGVASTRNRRPLEVIYTEVYEKKSDALAREKYLKTGKGREELSKLTNT